jgi:hypothetical protein
MVQPWFFNHECPHIFGKQTGYIFQSSKNDNNMDDNKLRFTESIAVACLLHFIVHHCLWMRVACLLHFIVHHCLWMRVTCLLHFIVHHCLWMRVYSKLPTMINIWNIFTYSIYMRQWHLEKQQI